MKHNEAKDQGMVAILERKKELEKRIQQVSQDLGSLTNVQSYVIAAGEANTRLLSFINLNGGEETKVPEKLKSELLSLKKDAEQKKKTAKEAKQRYKALLSQQEDLRKQLSELKYKAPAKSFKIETLEKYIRESIGHLKQKVNEIRERLDELLSRREQLKSDLRSCSAEAKSLDDDSILEVSVEDHMSDLLSAKQLADRRDAVDDLLMQTETAIKQKQDQLDIERKEFADALTFSVTQYVEGARVRVARSLKKLLESDDLWDKTVRELCHKLISETGARPVDVFEFTGGTLPVETHLIQNDSLRAKIKQMTDAILIELVDEPPEFGEYKGR